MKTLLLSALMALVAIPAMAQGTPKPAYINFSNAVLGGTPEQGGGVYRDHARMRVAGVPVPGSGLDAGKYFVVLFYGTEGTGAANLQQAGAPATFLDLPGEEARFAGFFAGGRRDLVGIETTEPGPGPIVEFQIRLGHVDRPGIFCSTSIFYSRAGNGNNLPPDTPPNFSAAPPGGRVGFTGSLCIPEPSSVGIGLLGIAAGVFVRRRK